MIFRIDKRQFNKMKKAFGAYKDAFNEFKKMNEKTKKEISMNLIEKESRSSVEISRR